MKRSQRYKFRPVVAGLEDRHLLTAPIAEFPIPAGAAGITSGPDGNLWFTLVDDQIGRITPAGQVTVFPIPHSTSGPSRITSGPDGNLWFTYAQDLQIGRMTPTGLVTVFPYGADHSSAAGEITGAPDGNVWFTEVEKIGRITPAGQVTEFSVPTPASQVASMTPGPDGNLWFSETAGRAIGRITPAGQITEFPFDPSFPPSYITFGLDGIL
jgi:virginiamycin B lyase